jgi:hypothetical protein
MSSENFKVEEGNNSTYSAGERELEPIIDEKKQVRLKEINLRKEGEKKKEEAAKEARAKAVYEQPNNESKTSTSLYNIKKKAIKADKVASTVGNDAEVLLLQEHKETDIIFNSLAVNSKRKFVESTLNVYNRINTHEKAYKGTEGFKGQYIKQLANKYFLQILPLHELKAYINDEAAAAILNFSNTFKEDLNQSAFYILTAREDFKESRSGTEVKTCIIFFRPEVNKRQVGFSVVLESEILLQIYSSGEDFDKSRIYKKYVDTTVYKKSKEEFSLLGTNIVNLVLILLWLGIIYATKPDEVESQALFLIVLLLPIVLSLIYVFMTNVFNTSDEYWNGFGTKEEY